MAATIARATGQDSTRTKSVHRLGSQASSAQVATWRTFVDSTIFRDGSGYVEIKRGRDIYRVTFNAETDTLKVETEG